jgi:hypothetical protein
MTMRRTLLTAAVALAFAMDGCGHDRVMVGNPPPIPPRIYPLLLDPYSVMDALRTAYGRRDSAEIKLLYDMNYQGTSIDQTDPAPAVLNFNKADEVRHVVALAKDPTILHVSMVPTTVMQRFTDLADPPGWSTIQNPIASLEVSSSTSSRTVDIANETMVFKFIPHTPDPTSATDTTWKIIRWTEVRN